MGHLGSSGLSATQKRARLGEVVLIWLAVLLAIRGVLVVGTAAAAIHSVLGDLVKITVPLLFMYAPVWLLRRLNEDPDRYPLAVPAFSDRASWSEAIKINALVIPALWLPWLIGFHLWFGEYLGFEPGQGNPNEVLQLIAYHLFFVAIPEELFYRGYMQSRLNEVFPSGRSFGGVKIGTSVLLTSFLFALGHSLVQFQWWHFSIFFPGLIFGWMREKTGDIMGGAFFHAWCNVTVSVLLVYYGVSS